MSEWRPRLSIEITKDQYLKLQNLVPWGVKGALFSELVDGVIELLEKEGEVVIAAILSKQLKAKDILEAKDEN
jgi:predicted CopG family antitoxin